MKKSLLALAVLGAFAGIASAQSSVTLYGLIDANLGKDPGSAAKRMGQGATSRLGVRGVEDLGGGMSAIFDFQHRFTTQNGQVSGGAVTGATPNRATVAGNNNTFWQARSTVGLSGGFGTIKLGREYNGAFFMSEVVSDAFGYDTVAGFGTIISGNVSQSNVNRSVTYVSPSMGGLTVTGQVAESNDNGGVSATADGYATLQAAVKRPYSGGIRYAAGPVAFGVGYNNPGNANDKWMSLNAQYNLGAIKLWGFLGNGTDTSKAKVKSWMLAATVPMGQGELKAGYGRLSNKAAGSTITNTTRQQLSLGYHYALSKRTTVYADFVNNNKQTLTGTTTAGEKNGYDFGVKHAF